MIWFGFLGIFLIISIIGFMTEEKMSIVFFIVPIAMAIFGYFLMKALVFDLMDEVRDEGSYLLIKNKGMEERVYFKNIKNISYTFMTNPDRVTLSLRIPGQFGDEVTFCPKTSPMPFRKNKDILGLIDKVDKAKSG